MLAAIDVPIRAADPGLSVKAAADEDGLLGVRERRRDRERPLERDRDRE